MIQFAPYIHQRPLASPTLGLYCMPGRKEGKWDYLDYCGRYIEPAGFEEWKTHYYRQEGWDPATGYPTGKMLASLGLDNVSEELALHKKLGKDNRDHAFQSNKKTGITHFVGSKFRSANRRLSVEREGRHIGRTTIQLFRGGRFLSDPFPRIDFTALADWVLRVMEDPELSEKINDVTALALLIWKKQTNQGSDGHSIDPVQKNHIKN